MASGLIPKKRKTRDGKVTARISSEMELVLEFLAVQENTTPSTLTDRALRQVYNVDELLPKARQYVESIQQVNC